MVCSFCVLLITVACSEHRRKEEVFHSKSSNSGTTMMTRARIRFPMMRRNWRGWTPCNEYVLEFSAPTLLPRSRIPAQYVFPPFHLLISGHWVWLRPLGDRSSQAVSLRNGLWRRLVFVCKGCSTKLSLHQRKSACRSQISRWDLGPGSIEVKKPLDPLT